MCDCEVIYYVNGEYHLFKYYVKFQFKYVKHRKYGKNLKMAIENAPMDFPKHFQAERAKFGHVQHLTTTTARHIKRCNKRIALNIYQPEIELVNFTKEKKKRRRRR